MKKRIMFLIPLFVLVMLISSACANTPLYLMQQATVGWEKIADATDYVVYKRPATLIKSTETQVGETTANEYTFTFDSGLAVYVGVQARATYTLDNGDVVTNTSIISWSDNPEVCEGGVTFGFYYMNPLNPPTGLIRY